MENPNSPYYRRNSDDYVTNRGDKSPKNGFASPKRSFNNFKCRICNNPILKMDSQIDFEGKNIHIRCLNHTLWHKPNCDCLIYTSSRYQNRSQSPNPWSEDFDHGIGNSEHSNQHSNSTNSLVNLSINSSQDNLRAKSPFGSNRSSGRLNIEEFIPFDHHETFQFISKLIQPSNINHLRMINSNFVLEASRKNQAANLSAFLQCQFDPFVINFQDEFGRTALIWASQRGHIKCCEILVQFGANMDIKNKFGYTALILASKRGNAKVVELLLRFGADCNIVNDEGLTAFDVAKTPDIRKLLLPSKYYLDGSPRSVNIFNDNNNNMNNDLNNNNNSFTTTATNNKNYFQPISYSKQANGLGPLSLPPPTQHDYEIPLQPESTSSLSGMLGSGLGLSGKTSTSHSHPSDYSFSNSSSSKSNGSLSSLLNFSNSNHNNNNNMSSGNLSITQSSPYSRGRSGSGSGLGLGFNEQNMLYNNTDMNSTTSLSSMSVMQNYNTNSNYSHSPGKSAPTIGQLQANPFHKQQYPQHPPPPPPPPPHMHQQHHMYQQQPILNRPNGQDESGMWYTTTIKR